MIFNPLRYFLHYFETNYFTLIFLIFLIVVSLLKYLRLPVVKPVFLFLLFLLLGLGLRLGWVLQSSHVTKDYWAQQHMVESDWINRQAIDLTEGIWFRGVDGQPSGRRPIGYPMFLAIFYKLFGSNIWVAHLLNLTLFAVSFLLLYWIARKIFDKRVALAALLFYACYPVSIYSYGMVLDEHLFLPLWYAGLFLLVREIFKRPVKGALIWYGLLFGYCTMTRTHTIFMPVVVGFAYVLLRYPWRRVFLAVIMVAFLSQLINLPWVVRNYRVWGVRVLYTATANYVYTVVNSSATPEGVGHIPVRGEEGYSEEIEQASHTNEGLYHVLCNQAMKKWVLAHPLQFLSLGTSRAFYFMDWARTGVWSIWLQYEPGTYDPARPLPQNLRHFFEEAAYSAYYVLLMSFLFSIIYLICRRASFSHEQRIAMMTIGACFLFWCAEQMFITPDKKYRFPLEPLMMMYAAAWWMGPVWKFGWGRKLKNAA